jgi:uncharacterized membrane protein YtjA (UPF0391 family)
VARNLHQEHRRVSPQVDEIRGTSKEIAMLNWALMFLLIAILAAVFGFGGIAFAAAGMAKLLFFIFLVLFLVSLVAHGVRRV